MSYSFNVKAATKAEAEQKVRDQLVTICEGQPVHKADCDQAFEAASSFLKLLADDQSRDVAVDMHGSIWQSGDGVQQASVSVNVGFAPRA